MSVHMIVGITVGNEKIINSLHRRGVAHICISDEDHEGSPVEVEGITYYSTEDTILFWRNYPDMTFHFYRNNSRTMDISDYEF